jgi:hypothetical protein
MTKAAIASRYRPPQRQDIVATIMTELQPADTNAVDTSTAPIKAAAVAEIARFITAAVVSTAKTNPSGLERLARVQGPSKHTSIIKPPSATTPSSGLLTALDTILNDLSPASVQLAVSHSKITRKAAYSELEGRCKLPLISCGIFPYCPLRAGSWVACIFQGRYWIGEGEYLSDTNLVRI